MNSYRRFWIAVLVLACLVGLHPTGVGAEEKKPTPSPTTVDNPTIAIEDLSLLLKPLTKEELAVEADAWRDLLRTKVKAISNVEIQANKTEGDAKVPLLEQATTLREERTALIDRTNAVLEELRTKGGKVEDYEKYISAVSGLTIDVTDTSAAWTTIRGWLTSPEGGLRWAKNIALFVLTLLVFKVLARLIGGIAQRALASAKITISDMLRDFFVTTVRNLVFILGIIVALSMLEVNIGPFLAALGVAGFVIGFALQGTLGNFAAGLMILLYRPYDIGNYVSAAGVSGTVASMNLVSTVFKTPDNQNVVVPNGAIWGGVITNITGNDTRRVDLRFGISYSDDIAKAQSILEDIVTHHSLVLKEPAPVVRLHELGDSSVNFVCRPWCNTSDYWTVYWDVTRAVKERFDAEGISIPFPQRDVHLHQVAG